MPGRCFLAFDLPSEAIERLGEARVAFLAAAPDWHSEKWVDPTLLHVTLKFIGPLEDPAIPSVVASLEDTCARRPHAGLSLESVRAVPSPRRATMLWATMRDADGSMSGLARAIDEILAGEWGVPASDRSFFPHVTLARARRPRPVPPAAIESATARLVAVRDADGTMSVRSLTLYSSTLGPAGPTYETLAVIAVGTD